MRVLPPAQGCRQIDVAGRRYTVDRRTGAFEGVRDDHAKAMVKGGECFLPSVRANNARGFRCGDCAHLSLFKNRCGRCGCTTLTEE